MAGHGINQLAELAMGVLAISGLESLREDAAACLRFIEYSKTQRPPSRPRGKVAARRVTADIVRSVKRRMEIEPEANQQVVATEFGIGTGGRVTEILNGQWDHLLEEAA